MWWHLFADADNETFLLSIIKQCGRHSCRQYAVQQLQKALISHVSVREEEGNLQSSLIKRRSSVSVLKLLLVPCICAIAI